MKLKDCVAYLIRNIKINVQTIKQKYIISEYRKTKPQTVPVSDPDVQIYDEKEEKLHSEDFDSFPKLQNNLIGTIDVKEESSDSEKSYDDEDVDFDPSEDNNNDPNEREWDERCFMCRKGGNLLCCDGCSNVSHLQCINLKKPPEGEWHCEDCLAKLTPPSKQETKANWNINEAVIVPSSQQNKQNNFPIKDQRVMMKSSNPVRKTDTRSSERAKSQLKGRENLF